MLKPLEKLKAFIEKGARNNANDAKAIQAIHDHASSMGAECKMGEAADFSNNDVMSLLNAAVKKQFKDNYSYPYIQDVYDDYLVFSGDYSSGNCVKCSYSVDESGSVTLGSPIAVVRKVTYIEPNTATQESEDELSPIGDSLLIETDASCIPLDENDVDLSEASRMLKLITPGWGSSAFYSEDVLKRDGPKVFTKGTHNYIDHLTEAEEKAKPEGFVSRLASVLTEDATWKDDYKGHGPGLYAKAKISKDFGAFLNTFGNDIGVSIRARGNTVLGEVNGRKGRIAESITSAKSVDYVTVPGAGGKILDLYESSKNGQLKENGEKSMPDEKEKPIVDANAALQESLNKMNARFIRSEATSYVGRVLLPLKVKESVKARISDVALRNIPMNESGDIDIVKFDAVIKEAVDSETAYLNSVGVFGKITGFGESAATQPTAPKLEDLMTKLDESLALLT